MRRMEFTTADLIDAHGDVPVTFVPGAWLYSDEDGLVVSPRALL